MKAARYAQTKTSSGASRSSGFTLEPRTKIWIIAVSLVVIIAASVYALTQPLRPDPREGASLWYPLETNPAARLQGVACTTDYSCRLNSIFAQGSGDQQEVWAVGNFNLVLHRKPGELVWEQLQISVVPESAPAPKPAPATTTHTSTPPGTVSTPPAQVVVPSFIGRNVDEAQKIAFAAGLKLDVQGIDPKAQQTPQNYIVVKQGPAAGSKAARGSTVTVFVGSPSGAETSAQPGPLDFVVPTVYASRPESSPQQIQRDPNSRPDLPLDDDLLFVSCDEKKVCQVLGRSGRVYTVSASNIWTFKQARFVDSLGQSIQQQVALLYVFRIGSVLARIGSQSVLCNSGDGATFTCRTPSELIGPTAATLIEPTVTAENQVVIGSSINRRPAHDEHFINSASDPSGVIDMLSVGPNGFIQKIHRNPPNIQRDVATVPSGTVASLNAFSFSSKNEGWIAGDKGTILSTVDGGEHWTHETQGPEGAEANHRLPALWYWGLGLALIIFCIAVVLAPEPQDTAELSVADWAVTDAPLRPGDVDVLDFTPMALGLSRFIRNPKTQPPVTIAIEGQWGEGKSSLMNLLREDLRKSRFRPVWFNAWHHQSEEQLLSSLLEHIHKQALPPWWHIDNWIFRARLVWIRFGQKWPFMLLVTVALAMSVGYEVAHIRREPGHNWREPFVSGAAYATKAWNHFWKDVGDKSKEGDGSASPANEAKDSGRKKPEDAQPPGSPKDAPQSEGNKPASPDPEKGLDYATYTLVISLLGFIGAVSKKMKAFGFDASQIADNLKDGAAIHKVKVEPGVRRQFAREFDEVCRAWSWGGRRVIIFIDDLDRCRPDSVVTVLESVNFLTTAGECMVVMGIAQEAVKHCVGLSFKDIAESQAAYEGHAADDQQKAQARYAYGDRYIRKLVNISAHLPKTSEEQRRRVLDARAAAALQKEEQEEGTEPWRLRLWKGLSRVGPVLLKMSPVGCLFLVLVLSTAIGYQRGSLREMTVTINSVPSETLKATEPKPDVVASDQTAVKPLEFKRASGSPATLGDAGSQGAGGTWWSYLLGTLILFLPFGFLTYVLTARSNRDALNSPEFEASLEFWGRYIVDVCETPREIKRALNDLRYRAMTGRNEGPTTTRGERLVRSIRQIVTGQRDQPQGASQVDESALPPVKAAELAALTEDEWKRFLDANDLKVEGSDKFKLLTKIKLEHIQHFERWITPRTKAAGVVAS